jgi:hypothetical protein
MAMITGRLAFTGPLRVKKRASQKTFPGRMSLRRRTLPVWQGALIVLAVFLAYLPALHGGFVWDDDSWTLNLSALFQSAAGLRTIWCHPAALQQYYPLTGTTFWLARERIGRGPAAAAFFFTGTLFPVLGFMNAYGMRYSFVWDHWVYRPVWGCWRWGRHWWRGRRNMCGSRWRFTGLRPSCCRRSSS